MAKISYAREAIVDLERISDFLAGQEAAAPLEVMDLIDEAIAVLARHPLIGREAEAGLHALIISHGRSAYIALYSFQPDQDAILILAIRHQREAGFRSRAS